MTSADCTLYHLCPGVLRPSRNAIEVFTMDVRVTVEINETNRMAALHHDRVGL
jgi:hypothetical protein